MYANGADFHKRRLLYEQAFTHESIVHYYDVYYRSVHNMAKEWSQLPTDEHIPLCQMMFAIYTR